jgi:2-polyprenyl-3-methyl-5-hydroxy-6-metoxy-1,4-benzoquinol methylase
MNFIDNVIYARRIQMPNEDVKYRNASYDTRQKWDLNWYNTKYQRGDFKRRKICDEAFVRALMSKYSIRQDSRLLDLGCGRGWYSYLFTRNGLKVTGVDISSVGIQKAKESYGSEINWIEGDGCNLPFKEDFEIVFASGYSPLNYVESLESSKAVEIGRKLFEYLEDRGSLVFTMNSNLSKVRGQNTIMNYSLNQVREYFLRLGCGKILGLYATHRQLFPIMGKYALSKLVTMIVVIGLRVHHKSVMLVCVVGKSAQA